MTPLALDVLANKVISIVREETNISAIGMETPLDSLGLDSLEFLYMMTRIDGEIAEIPKAKYGQLNTISDLVRELAIL